MMRQSIFYFLFFVFYFLSGKSIAQSVFNRAYDNDSTNDGAFVILQTLDGGFFIGGSGDGDIFIVKTNDQGYTEWVKYIDPNPGPYGSGISAAIQLKDSSYILCGFTKDTFLTVRPDMLLMKLDKNGNSVWQRSYDNGWNDYGDDVKQTADGGFIIISTSWDSTTSGFNTNAWLIKTDSDGVIEWDTVYGGSGDDVTEKILIDNDSGYAITGYTKSINGKAKVWLLKVNAKGDSLWQQTFNKGNDDGANDIYRTLDNGFVMVGFTEEVTAGEYDAYIVKTDSNGNFEWDKVYPTQETFVAITQLPDSNYVVAGNPCFTSNPYCEGLLMKLTKQGNSVWVKYYTHYGADDYVYDMQPTNDGGFIMAGMVTGGGVLKQDMWLVKTDCMGNDTTWDNVNCPFTGVGEFPNEEKTEVKIYPNPFLYSATIEIKNAELRIKNLELKIYDVLGREVKQQKISQSTFQIQRENLPNGIYFYKIVNDKVSYSQGKFIIQ